jgi:hypothetical protein
LHALQHFVELWLREFTGDEQDVLGHFNNFAKRAAVIESAKRRRDTRVRDSAARRMFPY